MEQRLSTLTDKVELILKLQEQYFKEKVSKPENQSNI
jgi:hypothetical protein